MTAVTPRNFEGDSSGRHYPTDARELAETQGKMLLTMLHMLHAQEWVSQKDFKHMRSLAGDLCAATDSFLKVAAWPIN